MFQLFLSSLLFKRERQTFQHWNKCNSKREREKEQSTDGIPSIQFEAKHFFLLTLIITQRDDLQANKRHKHRCPRRTTPFLFSSSTSPTFIRGTNEKKKRCRLFSSEFFLKKREREMGRLMIIIFFFFFPFVNPFFSRLLFLGTIHFTLFSTPFSQNINITSHNSPSSF